MIYPRRATIARVRPGEAGPKIAVAPYETMMLETVPVDQTRAVREVLPSAPSALKSDPPERFAKASLPSDDEREVRYVWGGTVAVPEVSGAELCVLVEGGTDVERAACRISISGRDVPARKLVSTGQFGAATDASPENWAWFIIPVAKGESTVQIELTIPADEASIGTYLRGFVAAENDPAPDDGTPVFPLYNSNRRAWSQTLMPLTAYPGER
jgi:hypothetical protein